MIEVNSQPVIQSMLSALPRTSHGLPILDGIVILEVLGKGGMGVVFKGLHLRLSIQVAVKILVENKNRDANWLNEARLAAKINHPNVVRIYDVDEKDGLLYIVHEYVDGESAAGLLARHVAQKTFIEESRALEIAADVARGLVAIHQEGIVHLDIKPANILIQKRDGVAKIADLGLARHINSEGHAEIPKGAEAGGTPGYMSPEQIQGLPPGPASDLYALGSTLYELATNKPAFGRSDYVIDIVIRQTGPRIPDPRDDRPDVNLATAKIVMKLLNADTQARFPNAAALLDHLLAARVNRPAAQPRKRAPSAVQKGKSGADIVCVDDDPDIRAFIEEALTEAGHKVKSFPNGADALFYLANHAPEMILLDVEMPGDSGLKVCKSLRAMPKFKTIPIVFMSGVSDPDVIATAMGWGATDYLIKPVSPSDLMARAACLTRLYRLQRERSMLESQYQMMSSQYGAINKESQS